MPTEVTHIDLSSASRIALALGAVNGFIVSLPIIWHWLQYRQWITGVEMGVGMFTLGVVLSILTTAITTVIIAGVFVVVYNLVAGYYGGIEVYLNK